MRPNLDYSALAQELAKTQHCSSLSEHHPWSEAWCGVGIKLSVAPGLLISSLSTKPYSQIFHRWSNTIASRLKCNKQYISSVVASGKTFTGWTLEDMDVSSKHFSAFAHHCLIHSKKAHYPKHDTNSVAQAWRTTNVTDSLIFTDSTMSNSASRMNAEVLKSIQNIEIHELQNPAGAPCFA